MVVKNILVVDDSPTELQLTMNALKPLNCRVTSATSVQSTMFRTVAGPRHPCWRGSIGMERDRT